MGLPTEMRATYHDEVLVTVNRTLVRATRSVAWGTAAIALIAIAVLASGAGAVAPPRWAWQEVAGTRLDSLPDADRAVMAAWGGGAWDTQENRLLIWGGGHGDSYDNSLYVIDPVNGAVGRLTERSPRPRDAEGREWPRIPCYSKYSLLHPDLAKVGEVPVSRHTYSLVQYIPTRHWFLAIGGSVACGSGGFATDTWIYDLRARRWVDMEPGGVRLRPARMLTVYDPARDEVVGYDGAHVYAYSVAANTWRYLARHAGQTNLNATATLDPSRRLMVIVGQGGTRVIRLGRGQDFKVEPVATRGDLEIERAYPGVEYHPELDRIVAWGGSSNNRPDLSLVYVLTLTRDEATDRWVGAWEAQGSQGSPPSSVGRGINGRLRWAPALGALVVASSMGENLRVLKALGGPGSARGPQGSSVGREDIWRAPISCGAGQARGDRQLVGVGASRHDIREDRNGPYS